MKHMMAVCCAALFPSIAAAKTIPVSPGDGDTTSIAKIESAGAGDEVVIAPGTYRFRLHLAAAGTQASPVVIRAQDPTRRPVWDLTGKKAGEWPGSYGGGDASRGIWQIAGSHYRISGVVFRGGTDGGGDGAGVRLKGSDHVTLHDCLFQRNDNGLQGAGEATLVEFCELDQNGLVGGQEHSHNLYIHGGALTVRYSFIHDARQSQNLHIRANEAVFEYNWIARSKTYMGDMMPCTVPPCQDEQHMVLRGNVIIRGSPTNDGQVFVMYNDQNTPNKSFKLELINNTIIGNGDAAALVHFANANPANNKSQSAVLHNNVIYDVASVFRVDESSLSNWTAGGKNNWISSTTKGSAGLTDTIAGVDPGFRGIAQLDLVPAAGSPLVGAASGSIPGLPDKEYYRDETVAMMWRPRPTVNDVGAFESTTAGAPTGPHGGGATSDAGPAGDGTLPDGSAAAGDAAATVDSAAQPDAGQTGGDDGCSCAAVQGAGPGAPAVLLLVLLGLALGRARR